jgi:hypothetical protein
MNEWSMSASMVKSEVKWISDYNQDKKVWAWRLYSFLFMIDGLLSCVGYDRMDGLKWVI